MEWFFDLYITSYSFSVLNILAGSAQQSRLSDEEHDSTDGAVSKVEIKAGLWSLKAFKSPGPDGLHVGFF